MGKLQRGPIAALFGVSFIEKPRLGERRHLRYRLGDGYRLGDALPELWGPGPFEHGYDHLWYGISSVRVSTAVNLIQATG